MDLRAPKPGAARGKISSKSKLPCVRRKKNGSIGPMEKALADIDWLPPKDTKFRRRLIYLRHLVLYATVVRRGYPLQTLGNRSTGCSWTFCPQGLGRDSIVYSGGVGNDVTFEHGLVKNFGCAVCLLDPSPTGKNTMSLPENQIRGI